jgi:3-deoxy-D-arabino-heptulosonate 7-phosphate (DAHP) synthase
VALSDNEQQLDFAGFDGFVRELEPFMQHSLVSR